MSSLNEKLKKCFKEGEKGRARHKGLKKINPDRELSLLHLNKAMHNFRAITFFQKNGFSDWSASAAFYALYHCLLAIIVKNGYESRNQSCTLSLVEDLINKGLVKEISKEDLKEIFEADIIDLGYSTNILDIRENMQYSIKTMMEDDKFIRLKERTSTLLEKLRREIER